MDVGPLQDSQLDSDFGWEIKTIVLYYIHLKSKNQALKNVPLTTFILIQKKKNIVWFHNIRLFTFLKYNTGLLKL